MLFDELIDRILGVMSTSNWIVNFVQILWNIKKHQNITKQSIASHQKRLVILHNDSMDVFIDFFDFFLLVFQFLNSKFAVETRNQNSLRSDMMVLKTF